MYFYPMAMSGRMCMSSSELLSSMGNVDGVVVMLQLGTGAHQYIDG